MATHRRDPMGIGLAVLNRIASSPTIDKFKLRKTTERAVYEGAQGWLPASPASTDPRVQARQGRVA